MLMISEVIEFFLSKPIIFNSVRRVIAGNQKKVKAFVQENLKKYNAVSVLDIGSGTGDYVAVIPSTIQYVGIDTSEKYLTFAKETYGNKKRKFFLQDATEQSFYRDKKFDVVILISFMHHMHDDELAKILPNVKKVAKKAVIVTDIIPNPEGWLPQQLVKLDRGRFVRSAEEKLKILRKYFKLAEVKMLNQKMATVCGVVCEIKK